MEARIRPLGRILTSIPSLGSLNSAAQSCATDFGGTALNIPIWAAMRNIFPLPWVTWQQLPALAWIWGRHVGLPISAQGLDCAIIYFWKKHGFFSSILIFKSRPNLGMVIIIFFPTTSLSKSCWPKKQAFTDSQRKQTHGYGGLAIVLEAKPSCMQIRC